MTRYDKLMARLKDGATVVIDGGTGTEVERRGVPQLENAWNGGGAISHPDIVRGIHEDYIRHGAEIVISNTFATSRNLMEDAGVPELFEEYNRRGVELAVEARAAMGRPDVLVAGSVSHWSFSGRLPELHDLEEGATHQAQVMRDAGADLIMLEMMIDVPRMLAVLRGAQASGLPVWAGLSCAPADTGEMYLQAGDTDENGVVMAGPGERLADAIDALAEKDVPVLSIMHTDVRHIDACLDVVDARWTGYTGVYAHSGEFLDGRWHFDGTITPDDFVAAAHTWRKRAVQVIGGCCGIRPDHMAALDRSFEAATHDRLG
ncbi:MAG: homocysteine S-methyltransferase family protein [Pseudomonadota bacterium]